MMLLLLLFLLPLNLITLSLSWPCLFPSTRHLLTAKMGLQQPPLISMLNDTAARGVNFSV
jgi:hypothetical protein